jgi:transcriptional regulator with XRE-family HTH domain
MSTFGQVISQARKKKGISQKQLAAQIKKDDGQVVSPQYLNDIERDRRNPPSEYLIEQLADVLEVSKDYLCLLAGTMPQELREQAKSQPAKVDAAFLAFRKVFRRK